MTTSKELWNDHRTASANVIGTLRKLLAEGFLSPVGGTHLDRRLTQELNQLDAIAHGIGEASVGESAAALVAKDDRAAQLTEALQNLQDDEDEAREDEYLSNLGAM